MLISALLWHLLDVYRPAAQEQLETLGKESGTATLPIIAGEKPAQIARRAMKEAQKGYDVLILDTAGRLHIDEEMMNELKEIKNISSPCETMLVLDSLTGQDAVNIGKSFHEHVGITSVALTRVDADGRGGAALSMRLTVDKPIKFIGVGEKMLDLQPFDPKRVASRILDMGDVVSLVEQASAKIDEQEAERVAKRMESGRFDLTDYISHIEQIRKMGGISSIMSMVPGMRGLNQALKAGMVDDSIFVRHKAMVDSMTPKERSDPRILKAKRKLRVANGSGTNVQELNKLLKQFTMMHKVMSSMGRGGPGTMQKMLSSLGSGIGKFIK